MDKSPRSYEPQTARRVAFVGLGVMGHPMAGHLARAGHQVTVYNRTAAKAEAWAKTYGGRHAATPAKAADGAEFVFACVGNDDDLRQVTLGDDGIFAGMTKGATLVDHTTASAEIARELHAAALRHGRGGYRGDRFLDRRLCLRDSPAKRSAGGNSGDGRGSRRRQRRADGDVRR